MDAVVALDAVGWKPFHEDVQRQQVSPAIDCRQFRTETNRTSQRS
jgi:hypothetical protein